jgi:hypothetical protein
LPQPEPADPHPHVWWSTEESLLPAESPIRIVGRRGPTIVEVVGHWDWTRTRKSLSSGTDVPGGEPAPAPRPLRRILHGRPSPQILHADAAYSPRLKEGQAAPTFRSMGRSMGLAPTFFTLFIIELAFQTSSPHPAIKNQKVKRAILPLPLVELVSSSGVGGRSGRVRFMLPHPLLSIGLRLSHPSEPI